MTKRIRIAATIVLMVAAGAATLWAQRGYRPQAQSFSGNVRYDGKFVFVRMSYPDGSYRGGARWAHDYPYGEHNFMKLFTAISNLNAHVDESNILSFGDPELFKFPVAYLVEPGFWTMSEDEVLNLRNYLTKGGFLIVDDFPDRQWGNFDVQMSRVFPEGRWVELDATHPIFHSFFEINSFDIIPMAYNLGDRPRFFALYEDNDPNKRMLVMANYQQDLSEFWEWSATGRYLVSDGNEAYKMGVNQFIYGITH